MEYGLRDIEMCREDRLSRVLILVLMEYGLRGLVMDNITSSGTLVLILVLMEYGLRAQTIDTMEITITLS